MSAPLPLLRPSSPASNDRLTQDLAHPTELAALLALTLVPHLSAKILHLLLNSVDRSAQALWQAPASFFKPHLTPKQLESLDAFRASNIPEQLYEPYEQNGIYLVPWGTDFYPARLQEIHGPPVLLFVKGSLSSLEQIVQTERALAVVGTRKMSDYAERVTQKLVSEMAPYHSVIVSGLAAGVDGCAHKTALETGQQTLAVFGCGVDIIYPTQHQRLAQDIVEAGGALVSEYPLGFRADKSTFPQRNRIVAGLSAGVLVTEGNIKSGSLITARLALEEGRNVYAAPGNLFAPGSEGPHYLIQQGALLVTQGEEIAKDLGWDDFPKTETVSNQLSFKLDNHTILKEGSFEGSVEERLVLSQISYDPMNIESLIEQTGLTSETLMMALTMLELADQIKTLPGHQVCRL